jgi:hypothetical protein
VICWAFRKNRNKACFEKIFLKTPIELICHSNVAALRQGADALLNLALGAGARSGDNLSEGGLRRLTDNSATDGAMEVDRGSEVSEDLDE